MAGGEHSKKGRYLVVSFFFVVLGTALVSKLAQLQIFDYQVFEARASNQHDLVAEIEPVRGRILVQDRSDGQLYPLATNREAWTVYAVPREMKEPEKTARDLAEVLETDVDILTTKFLKKDDPYEVVMKDVPIEKVEAVQSADFEGIHFSRVTARLYPEKNVSGQLIGFVGPGNDGVLTGKYGVEGNFNDLLAGKAGQIVGEKDASGRRIAMGDEQVQTGMDGADIVLTIDRAIQYEACSRIRKAVEQHGADSGSIVIMEPKTGAILGMCSSPDFDPTEYGKVNTISDLNNPVTFTAYEPGSIFKAMTLSAGLDAQKISPDTTYNDTGAEEIDDFTVRNSDGKANGIQTMKEVLVKSLNTGTIFVQRQLGKDLFRKYIEAFGFGKKTGFELTPEGAGNIESLSRKGDIFAATGSYGQGLTVTPLQILTAYGALANGGSLMRPYIVQEIIYADGTSEKTRPEVVGNPVSSRASRLVTGMMVAVVEEGHGSRASVPGYWVAGKTGTAQVPKKTGRGYEENITIGSFVGYAPASDPAFVMIVKIDNPKDVQWAESSAAPLFGVMAEFLLRYLGVPPERDFTPPLPPTLPQSDPVSSGTE
ncbi:MAG: penicillin-binding protein 2 [bacterium]|nr:penicillin-binding protein 2 [bacterium]